MSDRLIGLEEVKHKLSCGTTTVYALMKDAGFPRQIKLGAATRWSETEVDAWIEARKQARAAATQGKAA